MRVKVVKDVKYNRVYDVYFKRWYGWKYQYWVYADCIQAAQESVNKRLTPPSIAWEI